MSMLQNRSFRLWLRHLAEPGSQSRHWQIPRLVTFHDWFNMSPPSHKGFFAKQRCCIIVIETQVHTQYRPAQTTHITCTKVTRVQDQEVLLVLCLCDHWWFISSNEHPLLLHSLCQAELLVPFLHMGHVLVNAVESCLGINLIGTTDLDTVQGQWEYNKALFLN